MKYKSCKFSIDCVRTVKIRSLQCDAPVSYVSTVLNMSANIVTQIYDENIDTYIKNAVAYWPTVESASGVLARSTIFWCCY